MEGLQRNEIPGFLIKTYRLVDDSDTNEVISWSEGNKSFVVWSPITFAEELLPKHFKHNNFSSFVRQLNTYGFRKIDPDRLEFAHEKFVRDKPHLLKEIARSTRKDEHRHQSQQSLGAQQPSERESRDSSVEVANLGGLKEELETFKRDNNSLLKEVVKLRQQQQANERIMQVTNQRLERTEQVEQKMISFLAKAVESPDVLAQLVRQTQYRKKRAQKREALTGQEKSNSSPEQSGLKGQIMEYQPTFNDIVLPKLLDLRFSSFSYRSISSEGTIKNGEPRNFDQVPSHNDLSTVRENSSLDSTNVLPCEKVLEQSPQMGLIQSSGAVFADETKKGHSNHCQTEFELAASGSGMDSTSSEMIMIGTGMQMEEPRVQNPSHFPLDYDLLPCVDVNRESSQMGLIKTSDTAYACVNETNTNYLNEVELPESEVESANSGMMVNGMRMEEPKLGNPSDWLLDLVYNDISSLDLDELLPNVDFPGIFETG